MNNSSPKTVDTLKHAQWIIPIRPAKTQLQQHSLAIKDGIIVDLLPTELAKQQYCSADTQELEQHLLMPGLVNAPARA